MTEIEREDYVKQVEAEKKLLDYFKDNTPKSLLKFISDEIKRLASEGNDGILVSEKYLDDISRKWDSEHSIEERWELHNLKATQFKPEFYKVYKHRFEFWFFRIRTYVEEKPWVSERDVTLVDRSEKRIATLNGIAEWAKTLGYDVTISKQFNDFQGKSHAIIINWHNNVV